MKIKYIDSVKIIFEDGREFSFLKSNPPPELWTVNDDYIVVKRGEKIKKDIVINKSQKDQERLVYYIRGGNINIEINKSLKDYPDDRLDIDLRIEKLLEDGCILLEDRSKWQLTNITFQNEGEWDRGQYVRVSKGSSKIKNYQITNLEIDKTFFAVFMGFQKSQW